MYEQEIIERARRLRRQYPGCGDEFIVRSLEYDLGLRPAVIREVLADMSGD